MHNIRFQIKLNEPKHKKMLIQHLLGLVVIFVLITCVYFILSCQSYKAFADDSLTDDNDYLTLTASGGDVDITCRFDISPNNNIYFSTDNGDTWDKWCFDSYKLENGKFIQFKSHNVPDGVFYSKLQSFAFESNVLDAYIDCSGSVMSIVDGSGRSTQIPENYTFLSLFQNCTLLRTAPNLPATQLQESCYSCMFSKCSKLQNAPYLPAIEVPRSAYSSMFYECSSIVKPPVMEAEKLADLSCQDMFYGCTNLNATSKFKFMEIGNSSCEFMYKNCVNLKFAYDLFPKTIPNHAYAYMFQNCLSLERAPEIFGEVYESLCCTCMFEMELSHDSRLKYSPDLHCESLSFGSCESMFEFCTNLQNCPQVPATRIEERSCCLMFYGCESVVVGPELMATKLSKESYKYMFGSCTKLRYLKVGFNSWPTEENALTDWVGGVCANSEDGPGVFDAPEDLPWIYSSSHIPTNWINMVNVDVETNDVFYDGKPHCPITAISVTKPSNPTNPCEITYSLDGEEWFDDFSTIKYTEVGSYVFYVKATSDQQFDPYSNNGENEMIKQFADFNKKFVWRIKPNFSSKPPTNSEEEYINGGTKDENFATGTTQDMNYVTCSTKEVEYIPGSVPVETGDNNLSIIIFYLSVALISMYLTRQKHYIN